MYFVLERPYRKGTIFITYIQYLYLVKNFLNKPERCVCWVLIYFTTTTIMSVYHEKQCFLVICSLNNLGDIIVLPLTTKQINNQTSTTELSDLLWSPLTILVLSSSFLEIFGDLNSMSERSDMVWFSVNVILLLREVKRSLTWRRHVLRNFPFTLSERWQLYDVFKQ